VLLALFAPSEASAGFGDGSEARALERGAREPSLPALGGPRAGGPNEPEPSADDPDAPEQPNLFPRWELARAAGWLLPPEPSPSNRDEQGEASLEGYLDQEVMNDRIESGDVDAWYYDVARAMRQEFRPDRDAVEHERRAGMSAIQLLYDELRRYARGPERPQDVPGQILPEMRGGGLTTDPTDRRAAVEQEWWEWCNALNAPVTWYRVDLRVTHNPEGQLSAVWVLRSSGYRSLDRAALAAARSGSVDLRPPPDGMVGDRQAIRSDWSFEMGDVAMYPACMRPDGDGAVGTVSCVEDPVLGTMCSVGGIIRTRLRLLAVVDATHLTPEERRAARRADPNRPRP
jgi:TonB family protein